MARSSGRERPRQRVHTLLWIDGDEVVRRRIALRLNQREFAQRAGIDPGWLSKLERGLLTSVSPRTIGRLEAQIGALEVRRVRDDG